MISTSPRRRALRQTRPQIEGLEDRKLMYATLGGGWTYGSRITYSFAPDGTDIGGKPSAMFATMSSRGFSESQWQAAIQKAAAAWSQFTNLNLVLVPDDGSRFGVSGDQQGDPRFGDLRIGGVPQAGGVLASAFSPPPMNGGTLAGDIVMNTSQSWQINSDFDLQTVALHEIGHALGLDHSAISAAVMYTSYIGVKQTLNSDDIAGIRSIYGVRAPDVFDAAASNNSYQRPTDLNPYLDASAQVRLGGLDITVPELDFYIINAPVGSLGTFTATMQSSNLSSLSPKLTIFNEALQTVATVQAPNTFGATVTATVTGVVPGQKFYLRAQAASGGSLGIGAYGLLLSFGAGSMSPIAPPYTTVASQPDLVRSSSYQTTGHGDTDLQIGTLGGKGESHGPTDHGPETGDWSSNSGPGHQEWAPPSQDSWFSFPTTPARSVARAARGGHEQTTRVVDEAIEAWDD